ncbi:MAG: ABC transporter permease [Arachnia sp.]
MVTQIDVLMVLLAGVSLIVGMVGIANTTFISVIERTGEIGLRRALGARSRHILAQILGEAILLGALGGLAGASLGMIAVVSVCQTQNWSAVIDWRLPLLGPVLGLLVGALAGTFPAWRAAQVQPLEALRGQ